MSREIVEAAFGGAAHLITITGHAEGVAACAQSVTARSSIVNQKLAELAGKLQIVDDLLAHALEINLPDAAAHAEDAAQALYGVGISLHEGGQAIFAAAGAAQEKFAGIEGGVGPARETTRALFTLVTGLQLDFGLIAREQRQMNTVAAAAAEESGESASAGRVYAFNVIGQSSLPQGGTA